VLHEDLGFSQFIPAIHHDSKAYMETIVTMEKTMVSEHMPENKRQSKRWLKKGEPGPIKAEVQARSAKLLVITFFNAKGLIYTNIVPRCCRTAIPLSKFLQLIISFHCLFNVYRTVN